MTTRSFLSNDSCSGIFIGDAPTWLRPGARVALPLEPLQPKLTLWQRLSGYKPALLPVTTWTFVMCDNDDYWMDALYPTSYDFAAASPDDAKAAIDTLLRSNGGCTLTPHPDGYYLVTW